MPSGGFVTIDATASDVAMLDASAVGAPASEPLPDGSDATEAQAGLSQEGHASDEEDALEEEEAGGPPAQVSPMPPKRSLAVITPRSAKAAKKKAKGKASAKKGSGDASSGNAKSDGPATPPAAGPRSSSGAAVATPGEDSAKKDKSKKQAKKPSVTLHSFFGKAGTSAKKKGGGIKASSAKPKASSMVMEKKGAGIQSDGQEKKSSEASLDSTAKHASNDKAKAKKETKNKADKKGDGKDDNAVVPSKPPKKATTKSTASTKSDASNAKSTAISEAPMELDDTPTYALATAMRTISMKRRGSKGVKKAKKAPAAVSNGSSDDVSKENDVVVLETSVDEKVVASSDADAREEDAVVVVEELAVPEKGDSMELDDSEAKAEESLIEAQEAVDTAEEQGDTMAVVDAKADKDTRLANNDVADASGDAMDVDPKEKDNAPAHAPDETAEPSNNHADADDDSDATVSVAEAAEEKSSTPDDDSAEQASDIPAVISAEQDVEDDEVVVVDVAKKSVLEELPAESVAEKSSNAVDDDEAEPSVVAVESASEEHSAEDSAKGTHNDVDEVVAVDTPQASSSETSKAKKGAKATPKPRKKPAATSKKTPSKKKATPQKVKGMSPIEASLKKLAACPAKKSTPIKKTPSASTSAVEPSAVKVDATPSAKAKEASMATVSPAKKADSAKAPTENAKLSEEDASRLGNYLTLREKYSTKATELGERPKSDDFVEESLSLEGAADLPVVEKGSVEVGEDGFPDALLTHLSLLVQGRSLPLGELAKQALDQLAAYTTSDRPLTVESISSKIKVLAQRKSYLSGKPPAPSEKPTPISKLDCFENAEECYMWRWELSAIDFIPQTESAKVKKARTLRKKLQGHHKAIINLIAAIDKATACIQKASKSSTPAAGEKLIAKVSDMEEKVLKFEREEEKARLLRDAKLQKERSKAEGLAEKQREKERLEEERLNEKKRKEEEKAQKKMEAAKAREEAKRKKNEEKEQEKLKKQQEMEEKENMRKARMMTFWKPTKKKQKVANKALPEDTVKADTSSFDSDAFRKSIDSRDEHVSNPFANLSKQSKEARRRKIGKVRVSVFVTVMSENAFAPQPYDEERVITVPNRYKFLGFHEDVRPPYHGTWSKRSSIVSGRNPHKKDSKYLDYDVDSELEWEEGDDEEGEDLQDGDDGEEEDDLQNEEDNDGWLAAEDDLGIEDEDEDDETRELRKKKASASSARPSHFKACVVAPRMGGLTHEDFEDDCVIEGFSTPSDAMDTLNSLVGCVVTPDVSICLDLFPPADPAKENPKKDGASGTQKKELTEEDQRTMAMFVHNSTHTSKEIAVTELLKAHPTITNSRAQAVRELDFIAEKRRLANGGGALWEVKADHLKKLGLKKKDLRKPPKEASPPKAAEGGDKKAKEKKGKEKKDPNAPKRNVGAYLFYASATRNDLKAANPEISFGDVTKLLGEKWKALTAEERAPWDEKAATDKERYQKEMAAYTAKNATTTAPTDKAATPTPVTSPKPSAGQADKPSSGKAGKPSSGKKRKAPGVSAATVNLFASYLGVKKSKKTQKTE